MANAKRAYDLYAAEPEEEQGLQPLYLEALRLVERLHRRLLDVIKDEFDRAGRTDVNAVQALLLFNIGDSELTAGELRTRGYYLGSNVSYNLKKLVEMGFLDHQRSRVDRRSVRIKLTDKGREAVELTKGMMIEHERRMLECLSPAERLNLSEIMTKLVTASGEWPQMLDGDQSDDTL